MNKFLPVLIVIFITNSFSHSTDRVNIENYQEDNNIISIDSIELMDNQLLPELKGDWISTFFTDSIFDNKRISTWKKVFYGDLLLSINESDTLYIGGNMDSGLIPFYSYYEKTFVSVSEWGETKYTYLRDQDAIGLGDKPYSSVFKRLKNSKLKNIIKDEQALTNYVIKRIFKGNYLPSETISRINDISLGLETYTPFSFDAIGIENKKGETEYFAWKFIGDTLELYKTTTHSDDSGFTSYNIGKLFKKYTKHE